MHGATQAQNWVCAGATCALMGLAVLRRLAQAASKVTHKGHTWKKQKGMKNNAADERQQTQAVSEGLASRQYACWAYACKTSASCFTISTCIVLLRMPQLFSTPEQGCQRCCPKECRWLIRGTDNAACNAGLGCWLNSSHQEDRRT